MGYDKPHAIVYPNEAYPPLKASPPRREQPWLATRKVCGGLATCLRDRFVSLDAGAIEGELITKPMKLAGRELHINADATRGEIRVEVLDESRQPIPGFKSAESAVVRGNAVALPVAWKSKTDLASVAGKAVRFRITMRNARLYSFEVAP